MFAEHLYIYHVTSTLPPLVWEKDGQTENIMRGKKHGKIDGKRSVKKERKRTAHRPGKTGPKRAKKVQNKTVKLDIWSATQNKTAATVVDGRT